MDWGLLLKAAIGGAGVMTSAYGARRQRQYINQMYQMGEPHRMRLAGLAKYFVGGGEAKNLNIPMFNKQFSEVDNALQEKILQVKKSGRKSRRDIADTMIGNPKMRALIDSIKQERDQVGGAHRKAIDDKKRLNITLTNQWSKWASTFGLGPSYNEKLKYSIEARNKRLGLIGAGMKEIGELVGEKLEKPVEPGYEWMPGRGRLEQGPPEYYGGDHWTGGEWGEPKRTHWTDTEFDEGWGTEELVAPPGQKKQKDKEDEDIYNILYDSNRKR